MVGKSVCYNHGGKSLSGVESPTYKTGRFSKHIPVQMAARYTEIIADPHLVELRDELALIDIRLGYVLAKLDTGEAGVIWRDLRTAHADLLAARRTGNTEQFAAALSRIDTLIQHGAADYQQWGEILGLIESRRKVVESENKRLQSMQQMITVEQAMVFLGAVLGSVKQHVTDRKALVAISNDLNLLALR